MKKRGKLIYLGTGRHRTTFMFEGGRFVYKVPRGRHGRIANSQELEYYKRHRKNGEIPYAACRLLPNGVLIMEYVKPHCQSLAAENIDAQTYGGERMVPLGGDYEEELPQWTVHVECSQVGYDNRGTLVAYDFGG